MLLLFAGLFQFGAPAAAREGFAPGSVCWTSGAQGADYAQRATSPSAWTCSGDGHDWNAKRHFIRHDLTGKEGGWPRYAEYERNEFERLTISAVMADGSLVSREYGFHDTGLGTSSLKAIAEIPRTSQQPVAVLFTLDGGLWPESFAAARLVERPSVPPLGGFPHLMAALICGLLLAPIVFDFAFWRALRETFPLFHALFCTMALIQTAAVSGLLPLLVELPYETELTITYLSLDFMVAATMLFAYHFIEDGSLTRRARFTLLAIAATALANGLTTTFWPEPFGDWIDHVYFGIYLTLLAAYFTVLARAWRRGSRMAPYLILGFAPFTAIVAMQSLTLFQPLGLYQWDETWPQNFALLFEVVATALAVADRFITIRRERDNALHEAQTMVTLSERDMLTGLLNRRALDQRFHRLVEDGFHTLAVLDVDHFKAINDEYGHPVGDEVLRCVAAALRRGHDEDLRAFRIGGEEFFLMLRGDDAQTRAEARRRALTARVLTEMEGLDRPVTASMGLVDIGKVAQEMTFDFSAIYTRADNLLYEAKCAGRNRTVSEQLEAFDPEYSLPQAGAA